MNGFMAKVAFEGAYPESQSVSAGPSKLHRTGNVRGFHDGELRDSELFPSAGQLSHEQILTNIAGEEHAAKILSDVALSVIERKVDERVPIDPDNVQKSLDERERLKTALVRRYFEERAAKSAARHQLEDRLRSDTSVK